MAPWVIRTTNKIGNTNEKVEHTKEITAITRPFIGLQFACSFQAHIAKENPTNPNISEKKIEMAPYIIRRPYTQYTH